MRRPTGVVALVPLAFVVAACLTATDVMVDRTWQLAEVHGAPPVAEAEVSFRADGQFVVGTGCNTTGGTYHLDGNRILLDTVHQTMMLCDGEVGRQEAGVLAVVKGLPAYAIDTGTGRLRLTSEAGQVLLFEAP